MSSISTTPRRPSTAQPTSLNTRMPYEAGEALLWERQNARMHTHLSLQLKELQAQHAAYDSRISATEAIAEAAEAAIHQVKQLDLKVKAIVEEEKDRPFDTWAKEAIGQLQVAVDGLKGVRGKISGLERKVDGLTEDVESVRDEGALIRSVVRRLEVLEGERMGEGHLGERRDTIDYRQEETYEDVQEVTGDAALMDDNPLAVFYGIDTQLPTRVQGSPPALRQLPSRPQQSPAKYQDQDQDPDPDHMDHSEKKNTVYRQKHPVRKHDRPHNPTGNLQPPDEDVSLLAEHELDSPEAAPETKFGFENTQQFKDMQKELAELRAMCRTQELDNNNDTANTTQRPQETLIIHRENIPSLSDATTEAEADFNNASRNPLRVGASEGQVDFFNSDTTLSSSPPKRIDTKSARRMLMKRPSINDPRVLSTNADEPYIEAKSDHAPSLAKLPDFTPTNNIQPSRKRKRVDNVPAQRVTRPKLGDNAPTARKPAASMVKMTEVSEDNNSLGAGSQPFVDAPALASRVRKTNGKQKPAANRPAQTTTPQASSSRAQRVTAEPAVEPVKSRQTASKPKPTLDESKHQSTPAQAAPSTSKAPAAVKKEAKAPRQPAGACKSCRARHQKCDRKHPICGRCTRMSLSCEYHSVPASGSTAPSKKASTADRKRKAVPLPIKKATDEDDCEHGLRERSVTVSSEAPAKQPVPASPLKKPAIATNPTAASSRVPRAKNVQGAKKSQPNKKQK